MKSLLLFLFLIIGLKSYSQWSLSFGVSRLKDNLFQNTELKFFIKQQAHHYNFYTLQTDFRKNKFKIYQEFHYLKSSFDHLHIWNSYYTTTNYTNSDLRNYYSHFKVTYVGLKIGFGSEFKLDINKKWWSAFSYNFYGQIDQIVQNEESNKVMYRTTIFYNPQTQTMDTTVYPPNSNAFNMLTFHNRIYQFGIEFKERIGFNRYFVEFNLSLGSSVFANRTYTYNKMNESSWNFSLGIKIGALLFKNQDKTMNFKDKSYVKIQV